MSEPLGKGPDALGLLSSEWAHKAALPPEHEFDPSLVGPTPPDPRRFWVLLYANIVGFAARLPSEVKSATLGSQTLEELLISSFADLALSPETGAPELYRDQLRVFAEQQLFYIRNAARVAGVDISSDDEWIRMQAQLVANRVADYRALVGDAAVASMSQEMGARHDAMREQAEQIEKLAERAEAAVTKAEAAVVEARRASGDIGAGELAAGFEKYAGHHLLAALVFRLSTIVVLLGTVALSFYFLAEFDQQLQSAEEGQAVQFGSVAYRVAVLTGLAALAAYLGRQAGQHRRIGDWAKSLEVQLTSFRAFLETLKDDNTREAAQLGFAARVLGSPPEKRGEEGKDDVSHGSLQIIFDTLVRRSAPQ